MIAQDMDEVPRLALQQSVYLPKLLGRSIVGQIPQGNVQVRLRLQKLVQQSAVECSMRIVQSRHRPVMQEEEENG